MSRRAAQALLPLLLVIGVAACLPAGAARPTETPYVFHSPTPEPTPSWHKLQEAYVVAADRATHSYSAMFARQGLYTNTVEHQQRWCESFLSIDDEFLADLQEIPWTDDYKVQVQAVMDRTQDVIDILTKCTKAKTLKAIKAIEKKVDPAYSKRAAAVDILRHDLHLPPKPMR